MASSVLIIAKISQVRQALHSLLSAHPRVQSIYLAKDLSIALETFTSQRPTLVVIGPDEDIELTLALMRQIKSESSAARCLVFANSTIQEEQFQAAGADAVIWAGFPPRKLSSLIDGLLT